ncbi:pentapeptide repeat-containing protein [Anianabacter salinae]|uniref:pentapeptide repeat-containing protein n=1 Tax=Anianabacter salinae TaxID=2851023 RepID=UPI00225DEF75|nr:pentapeptide repeat-containing protein [Anianabacter salinae]MBV0912890.1 pentapeptide repeat-containing protein [Anianabacter salinae]
MNPLFGVVPWPLAVMAAALLAAVTALLLASAKAEGPRPRDALDRFAERFGAEGWPRLVKWLIAGIWCLIVVTLLCGALFLFSVILFRQFEDGEDAATKLGATIFSFTASVAALGAAVAFPFTLVRLHYNRRQVLTAEESLFNEKINAAATDLAARRQVTRVIGEGEEQKVLTEWEDDVVTRAAAIDRLEGLVEENHDAGDRVARLLSIYVRELSRQKDLEPKSHPRQDWWQRVDAGEDPETVAKDLFENPEDNTTEALQEWARHLEPIRSDMEKAVQTLGRLQEITERILPIDLRRANLQGFDLGQLDYEMGLFSAARMEGTKLNGARLDGAFLNEARMDGATLINARIERANLKGARMEGAILSGAKMEGAFLVEARLERAFLHEARMDGANLREARMDWAFLYQANMEGADLFGAGIEGADLSLARLKGADLRRVRFDQNTNFIATFIQYAAIKSTNFGRANLNQEQVNSTFGDGDPSTKLPQGIERPAHWPKDDLALHGDFLGAWREWQRAQGYIPYDER